IALHPGERGLSLGVRVLAAALVAVPAVFVACALSTPSGADRVVLTWDSAAGCLGFSVALGALPLMLVCALFRHAFPTAAPWRLGLLGAVSGLAGSIGCQAHCSVGAVTHVVVAHGFAVLLGGVVGAAYGAARGRT